MRKVSIILILLSIFYINVICDTIDYWIIKKVDTVILNGSAYDFLDTTNSEKSNIDITINDLTKKFDVLYFRDTNYETIRELIFKKNNIEYTRLKYNLEDNFESMAFTFKEIIKDKSLLKDDTLELYYLEKNEYFPSVELYLATFIIKDDLQKENNYMIWLSILIASLIILGIFIIKRKYSP